MNERQARNYVQKLRQLYIALLIYGLVNLGLILIWLMSGDEYFWPLWVIIGWGIGLGFHAFSLGLLPRANTLVPFLSTDWEEKEVERMMKNEQNTPK